MNLPMTRAHCQADGEVATPVLSSLNDGPPPPGGPSAFRRTIYYDDVPPSLNERGHWAAYQRHKKRWDKIFTDLLVAEVLPELARVEATAKLWFPIARRRDEGNFRWLLEKSLGDALQVRWLADDTPEFYSCGRIEFERGPKRTEVVLECWPR